LHLILIYLHEIVTIQNIPKKARVPDWTPSRAGSGPSSGLWGPLV